MMLSDLVVPQDVAVQMDEQGWTTPTVFVWVKQNGHSQYDAPTWHCRPRATALVGEKLMAPTVNELLAEFPEQSVELERLGTTYAAYCLMLSGHPSTRTARYDRPQEALAVLWIQYRASYKSDEAYRMQQKENKWRNEL